MRLMVKVLLTVGGVAATIGGGAVNAMLWASASPACRHTPLHVGCRHHSHGPAWHANHGRSIRDARETARKAREEAARAMGAASE